MCCFLSPPKKTTWTSHLHPGIEHSNGQSPISGEYECGEYVGNISGIWGILGNMSGMSTAEWWWMYQCIMMIPFWKRPLFIGDVPLLCLITGRQMFLIFTCTAHILDCLKPKLIHLHVMLLTLPILLGNNPFLSCGENSWKLTVLLAQAPYCPAG